MKRKKGVIERAMEGAEKERKAFMKAQEDAIRGMEAERQAWNKSVNGFITEQKQRKPRKPISKGLAMRLMARAQGKCEKCGKNLYNEKIDIHHKNSEPTDNRETNLMVVCKNCHKKLTGPRPNRTT